MIEPRPIAIVTDGMWRKSLSAIRALGKAGYQVHVLGDSRLTVGFWSRFTNRQVVVPDAKEDLSGFGDALARHLQELRTVAPAAPRPVLLPMEDATLRYVADHADALSGLAAFIVPEPEAFAICSDKAATMALAARLGVPHPRTEGASSAEDLLAAITRMAGREFVVKPVRGSGSRGVRYNPSFTLAEAGTYLRTFGAVVVQERIPAEGDALGVSVLVDRDGRCLAHFCHKRLRQFPNSGGPSTDRVSVEDTRLVEMSLRLLSAINWTGVAMVEWKVDPRSGVPQLVEINPRFWGSLELAVRSGVDFPVLYAKAAAAHSTVAQTDVATGGAQGSGSANGDGPGQSGVRCRWLVPGDILRWLTADKSDRESLAMFFSGLPASAEEWDRQDLPGFFACFVCQGLAVLTPKYRKMLQR